jgi:hypothetical protein
MIVNKDGMHFIRLGNNSPRRSLADKGGSNSMVHSLSSIDYLKIEKGNMIFFENIDQHNTLVHI